MIVPRIRTREDGSFQIYDTCPVCGNEFSTGWYHADEPVYSIAQEHVSKEVSACWDSHREHEEN